MDNLIAAAIPALLKDLDAKKAVIEYINALTDKERPEKEWRQVWWQLSDDVRRLNEIDQYSLVKNPSVRLYVTGDYSYRKIGLISAVIMPEGFHPDNLWGGVLDADFLHEKFHRETFTVNSYVDVIVAAQKAWELVHRKWVVATLPLETE